MNSNLYLNSNLCLFVLEIEKKRKIGKKTQLENPKPCNSPAQFSSQQPGHPGPTPCEARSGLLQPAAVRPRPSPRPSARAHASAAQLRTPHSPACLASPLSPLAPFRSARRPFLTHCAPGPACRRNPIPPSFLPPRAEILCSAPSAPLGRPRLASPARGPSRLCRCTSKPPRAQTLLEVSPTRARIEPRAVAVIRFLRCRDCRRGYLVHARQKPRSTFNWPPRARP